MIFANVKKLQIPQGNVKLITQKSTGTVLWKGGYTNLVPLSTEADGMTIYNGGLGYKDGKRIRSGGAEGDQPTSSITGFIPVKGGDIVRLSGYDATGNSTADAINVYDASKTHLGQIVANYPHAGYGIFAAAAAYHTYGWATVKEGPSGVWSWTAPPSADIAFMRVTGYTMGNGSTMIVTVNEEIE